MCKRNRLRCKKRLRLNFNIADQEVNAGAEHPYNNDNTERLGNTNVIVAFNDM